MGEDGKGRPAADSLLSVDVVKRLNSFTLRAQFQAPPGFTMLLGPSGGGKTTLLNCVAGLMRPDAGRIAVGAKILFASAAGIDLSAAHRRLGYLFQSPALFPHMTVAQNVCYGIAKLPAAERQGRMMALLQSFRIEHLAERKPGEISGGERQRAALARSLVTDPDLLLLDEPVTALDRGTKSKILDDLRVWNAAHLIPILYVTHSPEEAFALGERVIVLEAGQVVAQGVPQEVLTSPRHETVAQIVGFENVFDAAVSALNERQGTMLCKLAGSERELEVPLIQTEVGAPVRIAIRAGDIMIAADLPHRLSARNTLPGRVRSIRREDVRVIVGIEAGVEFEVHITPAAAEELGLVSGREVWLIIKTYSCNLVEPRV
ncbi:MAG TPA: molybdenum ABC transporter ATP-binding protein [Candidatus Binataceae bacterium]|nr:molybdenum ABC transporter ATP-binding protein [Candidatus Binataceae bacterium]